MKMRCHWLYWVLLVIAAAVIGSALGFGLRWWQQANEPTPPRYRVVLERPLEVEGANAILVILHLGSEEDPVRVARHYLQNQAKATKADLYQLVTPSGNLLALRAATFPNPEKLPEEVRRRLVPWERATRTGREGPYTIYRLEK